MDDQGMKDERNSGLGSSSPSENQGKDDVSEDALKREDFFTGLSFSALILSLSTSVLLNLGELPDPVTDKKEINLPLAKQTISIIEMLKDKTKGNLTEDEEKLVGNMLYDLRMKYVLAASS